MFSRITEWLRPPAIIDAASLASMLAAECAYISQKVPIDYVEARAHGFSPQLFKEAPFIEALTICTRESYAAVLSDLLVLTEGILRPQAGDRAQQVGDRLAELYPGIIERLDPPPSRPEGWAGACEAFQARFALARGREPRPAADIAVHGGSRMFATLPLHERFVQRDQDAIIASVQMRAGNVAVDLRKRIRPAPLIADLADGRA